MMSTAVNGVTYTLDNNRNLLSGGVNIYPYDYANRLKTFSNTTTSANYLYNSLNDRLQETVNGVTTTFTMDLNTGLTQALIDGTNHYIYGMGRIAQVNTDTEYFLGNALGSVRQLTDTSGAITYARAYDPYGVVTSTTGPSQSAYGFTGEVYGDSTQLTYLRSRYYSSGMGRFLTRDTWNGIYNNPITLNRWIYAHDNPVILTDPSGHFCLPCLIAALVLAGVISSSCSAPSTVEPQNILDAYPSDCRNLNEWFLNKIEDHNGYVIGPEPDIYARFLHVVNPNGYGDYRTRLRSEFSDGAIVFCWSDAECGFYDVSTPGNIIYGYLGAKLDIPRDVLHAFAGAGQISDEMYRLVGLSDLPSGLGSGDPRIYAGDSPGDFNAIELGYDLYESYRGQVTNEEFMSMFSKYKATLETRAPILHYVSNPSLEYSPDDCGNP